MPKSTLAWTSSAEMVWSGELRDDFRPEVAEIIGAQLSDDMWNGLCNVVLGYSMLLSHEHGAVGLGEQAKAVQKASIACADLISALETIQRTEYGGLLSGLVTDKWEKIRGREEAAERNQKAMAADIDAWDSRWRSILQDEGDLVTEAQEESVGWHFIRQWMTSGRIETPSVGADLLVQLWEVQGALKITYAEIKSGKTFKQTKGDSFVHLVGRLDEWRKKHGLAIGASKTGGRLTNLVRAILQEVPELRHQLTGKLLAKQIRKHITSELALAEAVLDARKHYRSFNK